MRGCTPHLPLWALYLQVFGTIGAAAIAAAIASVIQYRQWRVASDRLRFDLFERRLRIVMAINTMPPIFGVADPAQSTKKIDETIDNMAGYAFLFDSRTSVVLIEIIGCLNEMRDMLLASNSGDGQQEDWVALVEKLNKKRLAAWQAYKTVMTFKN